MFGVEQPRPQDLFANGGVEQSLQVQQQRHLTRTYVCLSVTTSSTTTTSISTAASSSFLSRGNNETPQTRHTFTDRHHHHRHKLIPTSTSPSSSSSCSLDLEQHVQVLEIHRAVLDQSASGDNQDTILSISPSSLPYTISPIPWNSTSPVTPRRMYDGPPSYHMPVPPLPPVPISPPSLPSRGAGAGARAGSLRSATEMQHTHHYHYPSSSSTSTSACTTIQHALLRR